MNPAAPVWLSQLPVSRRSGARMVALDNNAVANYFADGVREVTRPEVRYVFEDPGVEVHLCRQVIDEALNHPDLAPASRPQRWTALGELQRRGKVILSGVTQMTPAMAAAYRELQDLLARHGLSGADAYVVADALVKRVPLFTLERRLRTALENALRSRAVLRSLTAHGLPTALHQILVG